MPVLLDDYYYKTNETYVVAYIYSQGVPIKEVLTHNPRKYEFVFEMPREDGDKLFEDWWSNKLTVNPRVFAQGLDQVHDIIMSTKRRLEQNT